MRPAGCMGRSVEGLEAQVEDRKRKILSQSDLYEILPFGKTKINQLIKSGELLVVKVGRDYITTYKILEEWISNNIGEEIYY